jgi:signal transduction histidine kinase
MPSMRMRGPKIETTKRIAFMQSTLRRTSALVERCCRKGESQWRSRPGDRRGQVDSSAVNTAIGRIEQETDRLNAMVGNMLALARADAGESLMDRKPVPLGELLRKVVTDTDFEARNHQCHVVLSPWEECAASGGPGLLRSAVENVIRNAIRHTGEGTEVEIRLGCEKANGSHSAVIRIRDHGPGVAESALEQLFRPFFRLDESRERSTGGAGLGLAIARRAVQLHGGDIRAENCASGGLEVTITIPAASVARPSLGGS